MNVKPMLAQSFDKQKRKIVYPAYVQPKLDGIRCLAVSDGNKVFLYSRSGKLLRLPHIEKQLARVLPHNLILDGELYIDGEHFDKISSLVRKMQPDSLRVCFHFYDLLTLEDAETPFSRRLHIMKMIKELANVKRVKTYEVQEEDAVIEAQKHFVEKGYEGAIVRNAAARYKQGRSMDLQKIKTFQDAEFKIIGYESGEGAHHGCIVFVCENEEGKNFNVVPSAPLKERREMFKGGESYKGQMLTVKFFQLTAENIPRFPVALSVRPSFDIT